ncbi:MAG: hypothetical protein ACP5KN_06840, partial [Armatimonadota bacterium]
MMTTRPALLMALLVVLTVAGGCGGGGSGDGGMPPPGQPDNDWSVAEGVALDHPADAAPASPDSESALVGWSSDENLPATERELQQELNAWCEAVQADANDAGAQTGLIMALLAMAGQQAAPALGYNLFADYDLRDATSAAVTGKATPEVLVQDALRAARTRQVPPLRSPAASLQPQRETVSGEDLQQWRASITGYLVPAVTDLCARAGSIADSADPAEVLISYTADGETYKLYASDFHALAGGLELIRAGLLMVTAVNPDYGDFDWDVDTED